MPNWIVKRIVLELVVATAISVLVWLWFPLLSVGLVFEENESGRVECVCTPASLKMREISGGEVSFQVPRNASHFKFRFAERNTQYRLYAISLWGWPAFSAEWLVSHVASSQPIYDPSCLQSGEPLVLKVRKGVDELDYVRFFDLLLRLYQVGRLGLIALPFAALLIWYVVRGIVLYFPILCRKRFFAVSLIGLLLLSLPNPVSSAGPGLDESWAWMLNHLAFTQSFGRDIVFTYGPLGFLLVPQLGVGQILVSLVSVVVFSSLWGLLLWCVYSWGEKWRTVAWCLLLTMFFPQGNLEWRWILLGGLLPLLPALHESLDVVRGKSVFVFLGGMVLSIVGFMKFSSLVSVLGVQIVSVALLSRKMRGSWRNVVGAYFGGFVAMTAVLGMLCFKSLADVGLWIKGSLATASGYNMYMVCEKSFCELSIPFVTLLAVVVVLFWGRKRPPKELLTVGFLFSPLFFCTAKYAFVRQSAAPLFYVLAACLCIVAGYVPRSRRRCMVLVGCLYVFCMMLTLPSALAESQLGQFALGINPLGVVRTCCAKAELDRARSTTVEKVKVRDIPENWKTMVACDRVLFVPFEMGPAMSENRRFAVVPLPSMQLYSSCHPYLDDLNANLLTGSTKPEWIVCGIDVEWNGHMISYPRFWTAVLNNYDYVDSGNGYILLRCNGLCKSACDGGDLGAARQIAKVGEWIPVVGNETGRISVEWRNTFAGRLIAFFIRNSPCYVTVRTADGGERRFQYVAGNGGVDFSMSALPVDDGCFLKILRRESIPKITAIRFDATTSWMYEAPNIDLIR